MNRQYIYIILHQIIDQISFSELINKICPRFIESSTKRSHITKGRDKDNIMNNFLSYVEDTQGIDGLITLINHFLADPYFSKAYPNFKFLVDQDKFSEQIRKILILAAAPKGLRLDREIKAIREVILQSSKCKQFEVKEIPAITSKDLKGLGNTMEDEKPGIVHFCGHGAGKNGLLVENQIEEDIFISPEVFAHLFISSQQYIDCVVLNACESEETAKEISKHIKYVICTNKPVRNQASRAFSEGFYKSLCNSNYISGDEKVFQIACQEGNRSIQLEGITDTKFFIYNKY